MNHFKIAFYIRCSTEEQGLHANPEGTIKNQEQRLRYEVEAKNRTHSFGEVIGVFIEDGVSAKDTKRPSLQRMLKAIEQGEVNLVMVTEFSRLSRNMRDFAAMWELFKSHKCSVISLRESFDTSTAAGEMMLYNMANLAQYERRMTSERVTLSRLDRAQRGLFNGGMIPLGYKRSEKAGYLEIDEEEAKIVRLAFSQFLKIGTLLHTARWLNEHGAVPANKVLSANRLRIGHFIVSNLRFILTNKSYVGVVTYKRKGEEEKEARAVWEPLVEREDFDRVQKIIKENFRKKKPHSKSRYPYTLSGLVFCKRCNEVMCGKSAHGRSKKVGYYEHSWSMRKDATLVKKAFSCGMHKRVPAKIIEALVHEKVEDFLLKPEISLEVIDTANKVHKETSTYSSKKKALKNDVFTYTTQLEALSDRLAKLPIDFPADEILKSMKVLSQKRDASKKELEMLISGSELGQEVPVALKDYQNFLQAMKTMWFDAKVSADVKEKIIKKLVARIEIDTDEIFVEFWVGKGHFKRESRQLGSPLNINSMDDEKNLKNSGSSTCQIGGTTRT